MTARQLYRPPITKDLVKEFIRKNGYRVIGFRAPQPGDWYVTAFFLSINRNTISVYHQTRELDWRIILEKV